ncbi:sugar transferase [Selenihalanaerobacter shriftii]|uniref:Sugar transferase involved in LPS biosynthesis (Colanic, teichoic acid) n=1 Tax=Selenihalanaerobacter shriftii TaxID=142842 RepID=A0A1T4R0V4_9FIRM|nr:sugar transferase [Selenihalanaerobacter shriftii]SKA09486.1 Sugar transferase involved in LPS biosynthesis (colanic, teichoic acid) [Selenihalanaerobacter shriftii]
MKKNVNISLYDRILKRSFDILFSLVGLSLTGIIIIISYIIATIDTKENGFFTQERVGKDGKRFKVIKIKTMKSNINFNTTVTTKSDPRITKSGEIFRKLKIDELPQLINVLKGDMSFVGPRPDVPEIMETLKEEDKVILSVRPGITGPATLKYREEEKILAQVDDPEKYNEEVIFLDKVEINKKYIREYSFIKDIKYIFRTVFNHEINDEERGFKI